MVDSKKPEKGFSKVCYYELLDVDRKADTKAIKKVLKLLAATERMSCIV